MRITVILLMIAAVVVLFATAWLTRFTTNTAAGRFYKNDRWTGKTFVVEKDGTTHWLGDR